jgi:cytochrome c-type biogenesis protein
MRDNRRGQRLTLRLFSILLMGILLFLLFEPATAEIKDEAIASKETTHIFFSRGCADCWPYVEEVLLPALQSYGLASQFEIHDYTVPEKRQLLLEMTNGAGLPRAIADSLYTFVPTQTGDLVLLGHVPAELVGEAITSPQLPAKLVLWQPQMHGQPSEYRLWAWVGSVQTFPIDTPFHEALSMALAAGGPLPAGMPNSSGFDPGLSNLAQLLPAVVITGLLDSVNPCAFAVILLLLAFLFTLRQSRGRILQLGFVYILMIFLVYFTIGVGLLQAVKISDDPHFVARAGAWLLIGLGGINLGEYFFPRFPIRLHMPNFAADRTNQLVRQASLPATIVAGLLVGLCTFPCSGGIYVSIITLLNARTTFTWGLAYLGLYNLIFVFPLVAILLAAGNRVTVKAWARWERSNALRIRLVYGLAMVSLGAVMLFWVI